MNAGRGRAAVAGVVAAAAALATGELAAGALPAVASPVASVGQVVVRVVPPWLEDWAIAVFGTADKAVLLGGVIAVVVLAASGVGVLAARRFTAATAGVGALAAAGGLAAAANPQIPWWAAAVTTVVTAGVGIAALRWLLVAGGYPHSGGWWGHRSLPDDTPTRRPKPPYASRRDFLRVAGGLAAGAAAVAGTGRWIGARSEIHAARGEVLLPAAARSLPPPPPSGSLAIDGLTPLFVPNTRFYRIDTALSVPRVDPAGWRLRMSGMVQRPIELTYDELLAMPMVEADVTLACVSNEVGGDLVGNARWLGVPLADLLDRAGLRLGATQVVGRAVDGWTGGFPTELALDGRDALVAVGMNGEPLPFEHGFPARLVVPGLFGYVSATKWLSEIELLTWEGFDGYWIPRGWDKRGEIVTQSRIDVPRRGATVSAGPVTLAGVAWDTERGVGGVEMSIDDGDWQPAVLADALADSAWRQWRFDWDAEPGRHVLAVRAIDGNGTPQTATPRPPRPAGATGHHRIRVTVT